METSDVIDITPTNTATAAMCMEVLRTQICDTYMSPRAERTLLETLAMITQDYVRLARIVDSLK